MKCNYCGELLPNEAKFCPSCGHEIVERSHCPQCGTMMPEGALFCPNCGNRVSSVDDEPKVRDYYYTDGTWSTERDESKIVADQYTHNNVGVIRKLVRKDKLFGRNDLCPCGSGKKYKNCHGRGFV